MSVGHVLEVGAGLLALPAIIGCLWSSRSGSVPLPEAPVLGWRAWRIDRAGNLCSLNSGHRLGNGVQRAACDPRTAHEKRAHEAPGLRCSCGHHALSGYDLTLRAVAYTLRWERRALDLLILVAFGLVHLGALPVLVALVVLRQARRQAIVVGVVALSGNIAIDPVVGGVQLRAERLRLVALVDSLRARPAAACYHVPLVVRRRIVPVAVELSGAKPIDPWCLGRGPQDSVRGLLGWMRNEMPATALALVGRTASRRTS